MTRKTRYPEIAPRDRQIAFAVRGRDLQDSEKFRSGRQALLTEQWHNVKHAARRSRREFGTSYRHKAVRGRDLPGNAVKLCPNFARVGYRVRSFSAACGGDQRDA